MKGKSKNQWVRFNCLFKEMDDVYRYIGLKEGLSESVFNILYAICDIGDGCRQKDIAEAYFIKKQTLNSSVKNLEREGIIRLENGKGRDKRIFLTEKGRELTKIKTEPVLRAEEKAFLSLDEDEREKLLELYGKYINSLKEAAEEIIDSLKEGC